MKPWLASGLLMSGSALLLRLHVTVKLRAIMELDSACSSEQLACHYKYRSISSLPSHLDSILRLYTYSVAMAGSVESFLKLCCLFCLVATSSGQLSPAFYSRTCPTLQTIVSLTMRTTVLLDPRMGASLLRLFFHDCFVNGCDASVLLDDTATFTGEKNAGPNANSLRGFDVIDTIKTAVELLCPGTVSCADILALAARDGVALLGGPSWTVALGRRDATTASQSAANSNLPGPGSSLSQLIAAFAAKGLNARDMTALSGAHTIGQARCTYPVAMAVSVESFVKLCCLFCLVATSRGQLSPAFYSRSCPTLQTIVRQTMRTTVLLDPRMGASLLRLFFHDCFVNGCDASVLLDDTATFNGEKNAGPNANSLRGFEVIDTIKAEVELQCPGTVSCADILALAARDGVALLGGPSWRVPLGRRDATTASQSAANSNLPSPASNLSQLIAAFAAKGLNARDMTALSGAHTIGQARCVSFRSHIYNDANVDAGFASQRQRNCPSSGGDNNLAPLDVQTPNTFDNTYFRNLIALRVSTRIRSSSTMERRTRWCSSTAPTPELSRPTSRRPW
ncbi:Peroxidase [Musa troglodytarum]|uniref:Peroxidase 1 n=1 Tax=Musa troglodytarum TaxID=320322 RepID=A0A9E7IEL6_9LILI|nr:Peroxidase [Musa troglodytarum]